MKLVVNTGRTVAVVARELGINEATLGRWVNLQKGRQDAGDGALSETERAELARLRKENSELKLDRTFLKKRESDEVSGGPRISADLREDGEVISQKTVA